MKNQKSFAQASHDNAAIMRDKIKARDLERQKARDSKKQNRNIDYI